MKVVMVQMIRNPIYRCYNIPMNTRPSRTQVVYTIAIIGFIYTLHLVLPTYSNSSFLSIFLDEQTVGYVYMLGATVSVLGFLIAPYVIRRFGNYKTTIYLICIQIALFYGLIASSSPLVISILFALETAIVSLIGLNIDIFLEKYTDGGHVGTIRGLFSATLNASWVIAPLIGTMLINGTNNYRNTYLAALAMLFPLLYLIYKNFPRFEDPNYTHISPHYLIKRLSKSPDLMRLFWANIILQTFYAWMVVYSPIYLNKIIGFTWEEIGIILVIMLLPFPIIQYPLGKMSDKANYGEKKIMSIGFAIMGAATIALTILNVNNLFLWSLMLLITRIGAAAAEVMIETYFFKTVPSQDTAILGFFRVTRPVAYFFAPIITLIGIYFTGNEYPFMIVGLMCLLALYPVLTMKDA